MITFELGDDVVATSAYRVKSKKYVGHTYGSFKTIASNVSGAKTNNEVLSANATISYSNSISGSLSLSTKKSLKATMGFDVTKSSSVSAQYRINLKKGQKCKIKARPPQQASLFGEKSQEHIQLKIILTLILKLNLIID